MDEKENTASKEKKTASNEKRIKNQLALYPTEFTITPKNELYCKICNKIINTDKKYYITNHRKSSIHSNKLILFNKQVNNDDFKKEFGSNFCEQSFFDMSEKKIDFAKLILKTFLSSDIPVHKLRHKQVKNLFNAMHHPLPSESTILRGLDVLYEETIVKIKNKLQNTPFFLVIDETTNRKESFTNVMVGRLDEPSLAYLVKCDIVNGTVNAEYIVNLIESVLQEFSLIPTNFFLLLSDSASYMSNSGKILKSKFPFLFHITCIIHLYHNMCFKIMQFYEEVNELIASIKSAVTKNKTRKQLFYEIGQPPDTIVTRFGSWLKAARYYSINFTKVKYIVNSFEDDGILVEKAKSAVNNSFVKKQLLNLELNYFFLIDLIDKSCNVNYSI